MFRVETFQFSIKLSLNLFIFNFFNLLKIIMGIGIIDYNIIKYSKIQWYVSKKMYVTQIIFSYLPTPSYIIPIKCPILLLSIHSTHI